jgi:hypothetical protein
MWQLKMFRWDDYTDKNNMITGVFVNKRQMGGLESEMEIF